MSEMDKLAAAMRVDLSPNSIGKLGELAALSQTINSDLAEIHTFKTTFTEINSGVEQLSISIGALKGSLDEFRESWSATTDDLKSVLRDLISAIKNPTGQVKREGVREFAHDVAVALGMQKEYEEHFESKINLIERKVEVIKSAIDEDPQAESIRATTISDTSDDMTSQMLQWGEINSGSFSGEDISELKGRMSHLAMRLSEYDGMVSKMLASSNDPTSTLNDMARQYEKFEKERILLDDAYVGVYHNMTPQERFAAKDEDLKFREMLGGMNYGVKRDPALLLSGASPFDDLSSGGLLPVQGAGDLNERMNAIMPGHMPLSDGEIEKMMKAAARNREEAATKYGWDRTGIAPVEPGTFWSMFEWNKRMPVITPENIVSNGEQLGQAQNGTTIIIDNPTVSVSVSPTSGDPFAIGEAVAAEIVRTCNSRFPGERQLTFV